MAHDRAPLIYKILKSWDVLGKWELNKIHLIIGLFDLKNVNLMASRGFANQGEQAEYIVCVSDLFPKLGTTTWIYTNLSLR